MIRTLIVSVIALLLTGCGHPAKQLVPGREQEPSSEFLVPEKELPERVIELARRLERLPHRSTRNNFEFALSLCGLNREPDWYKDGQHYWYLNSKLKAETSPQKSAYVVSVGYYEDSDSTVTPYDAAIRRSHPGNPRQRETIWRIKY